MDQQTTDASGDLDRIRSLATSLDGITEPDFCLLAGITPRTAADWRRRGKGPAYAVLGNRCIYLRSAVAEFIAANVRERRPVPTRTSL